MRKLGYIVNGELRVIYGAVNLRQTDIRTIYLVKLLQVYHKHQNNRLTKNYLNNNTSPLGRSEIVEAVMIRCNLIVTHHVWAKVRQSNSKAQVRFCRP